MPLTIQVKNFQIKSLFRIHNTGLLHPYHTYLCLLHPNYSYLCLLHPYYSYHVIPDPPWHHGAEISASGKFYLISPTLPSLIRQSPAPLFYSLNFGTLPANPACLTSTLSLTWTFSRFSMFTYSRNIGTGEEWPTYPCPRWPGPSA